MGGFRNLQDKVVIVTGASMGIGKEIALAFAAHGARVVLAARQSQPLQAVADEITRAGGTALAFPTDVTDRGAVDTLIAATVKRWNRVDILINNAGVGLYARLKEMPEAALRTTFDVNLFGPLHCIQAVYPQMRIQGGGQIINVSSIIGLRSVPNVSGYCMSKFALNALTDALRLEARADNIEVLNVYPGLTATDFRKNQKIVGTYDPHPTTFRQAPEAVAKAVVSASRSGRRDTFPNRAGKVLYLLHKFAPRLVDRMLWLGLRRQSQPAKSV